MYVYVIACVTGRDSFYKIGKARSPEKRLGALQVGCPWRLELVASFRAPCDVSAFDAERDAHQILRSYWWDYEWFKAPENVVLAAVKEAVERATANARPAPTWEYTPPEIPADMPRGGPFPESRNGVRLTYGTRGFGP